MYSVYGISTCIYHDPARISISVSKGEIMKTAAYLFLITVLCAFGTNTAAVDNSNPEARRWETAYINLGYYIANLDSSFRVGGDNLGVGIDINVEEFLGLDQRIQRSG